MIAEKLIAVLSGIMVVFCFRLFNSGPYFFFGFIGVLFFMGLLFWMMGRARQAGWLKKIFRIVGMVFWGFVILYGTLYTVDVFNRFTIAELDFNRDGTISLKEFDIAGDVYKHSIVVNGKNCTEYYTSKIEHIHTHCSE